MGLSLVVLLGLPGCFATQNTSASAEYARQVTTASLRTSQLEQQLVESYTRIEQLEEFVRLQGQSQATKMENLDQVNAEVTRLRGAIEVLQFENEKLQTQVEAYELQQELRQLHDEGRLAQVEQFLGVQAPTKPTAADLGLPGTEPVSEPDPATETDSSSIEPPGETAVEAQTEPEVPSTAEGKLVLAKEHMAGGRFGVARVILERARADHPDADELPEIDYRVAETWREDGRFSKAALAYKGVIDDHPGSPWASWSMLRQGDCFDGLGQKDNARLFWDGVIQRFPRSDAAKEAKSRLGR